jgi:hypothetical protein
MTAKITGTPQKKNWEREIEPIIPSTVPHVIHAEKESQEKRGPTCHTETSTPILMTCAGPQIQVKKYIGDR